MHPIFSDLVVAAFITGSLAFASVIVPLYLKNKRSMRKVSAEEFIESFMKRQEQEIVRKNILIEEMEITLRKQETTIRQLETSVYKKDVIIKQLKALAKELKAEIKTAKQQSEKWRVQLDQMKQDYKDIKK